MVSGCTWSSTATLATSTTCSFHPIAARSSSCFERPPPRWSYVTTRCSFASSSICGSRYSWLAPGPPCSSSSGGACGSPYSAQYNGTGVVLVNPSARGGGIGGMCAEWPPRTPFGSPEYHWPQKVPCCRFRTVSFDYGSEQQFIHSLEVAMKYLCLI